ncbi:hypothetical protein CIHG_03835 [Coccidioides immitis H538.4]|uniref:Uncharacterized protein n=3 Tax=Coccidioides immitis TaxID=5501 RepID=A0A0J8QQL6_COCIT|nr:hypothetical protein CIRG_03587 [Coccidioides immitis RMSCC 2394]KMU74874.1 hypothetical protein CISG_00804 [Coccidioides immitis RMSCC 3703]KMU86049.1 hypothetical protein CIHG_03835 [Coccidioides immitis H538.4]
MEYNVHNCLACDIAFSLNGHGLCFDRSTGNQPTEKRVCFILLLFFVGWDHNPSARLVLQRFLSASLLFLLLLPFLCRAFLQPRTLAAGEPGQGSSVVTIRAPNSPSSSPETLARRPS